MIQIITPTNDDDTLLAEMTDSIEDATTISESEKQLLVSEMSNKGISGPMRNRLADLFDAEKRIIKEDPTTPELRQLHSSLGQHIQVEESSLAEVRQSSYEELVNDAEGIAATASRLGNEIVEGVKNQEDQSRANEIRRGLFERSNAPYKKGDPRLN